MRFSTVFSLALVTATVAPAVMSVPLAGRQAPPLPTNAVQPPLDQTSDEMYNPLIDQFLSALSPDQLQSLSGIIQDALSETPTSTNTTAPMPTTPSTPERRSIKSFFQSLGKGIKSALQNIF